MKIVIKIIKLLVLIIGIIVGARIFMAYDPSPWTVPDYSGQAQHD